MKGKVFLSLLWLAGICGCGDKVAAGSGGPGVTVEGKVSYSDGTPAGAALVRLRPWNYLRPPAKTAAAADGGNALRDRADAWSDSQGNFEITGMDTGRYVLEFQAGEESGEAVRIRIDGSPNPLRMDGIMRPTATLEGNIRDTAGKPVAGAAVALYGLELAASSDSTGYFRFDAVPPDTLSLRVSPPAPALAPVDIRDLAMEPNGAVTLDTITLPALSP
jgi:hypothetical protein